MYIYKNVYIYKNIYINIMYVYYSLTYTLVISCKIVLSKYVYKNIFV